MLVIYSLKNTITIQEIKKVLEPFHQESKNIESIYQHYLDTMDIIIKDKSNELLDFVNQNDYNDTNPENLLSMLLIISSLSSFYQTIAQKIIDNFYLEQE